MRAAALIALVIVPAIGHPAGIEGKREGRHLSIDFGHQF